MKPQTAVATRLFPIFTSVFFVTMTLIFLTVPYALSRHSGESIQKPVSAENHNPG